ncbi:MAG: transposase [bacterium]|nr:transposase [bacterium]
MLGINYTETFIDSSTIQYGTRWEWRRLAATLLNLLNGGMMTETESVQHLGWYHSGYLPHFDCAKTLQFITFRLADSLPQKELQLIKEKVSVAPKYKRQMIRRRTVEAWLDSGYGCCALGHPECARVLEEQLLKSHGDRYHLLAWCVMPNHIHVLIQPLIPLSKILHSWKSYTSHWAINNNSRLNLGINDNMFWTRDYFDRYIRDEQHYFAVMNYIHNNPVAAGLCVLAEDWRWSSAWALSNSGGEPPPVPAGGDAEGSVVRRRFPAASRRRSRRVAMPRGQW